MTFQVGHIGPDGIVANGRTYGRAGAAAEIPQGAPVVLLTIGRTPFAVSAGGYEDPGEAESA